MLGVVTVPGTIEIVIVRLPIDRMNSESTYAFDVFVEGVNDGKALARSFLRYPTSQAAQRGAETLIESCASFKEVGDG